MKKLFTVLFLGAVGVMLSACGPLQAGYSIYQTANAATKLSQVKEMADSLRNQEPTFIGFENVEVDILVAPRNEENSQKLVTAFKDNVEYIVEQNFEAMDSSKKVCRSEDCDGKTIVVQFKEKAYDENVMQKLFLTGSVRGSLYFVDKQTGRVLRQESFEGAGNYGDLLRGINTSVGLKVLRSIQDPKKAQKAFEKFNDIEPIKPEYKKLFQS
ncbi:MAG: hypothetical protein HYS21_13180 [Deltaproteobacteria bacterium]|nr:hypothetical protein [Deltaproteobacteria bacterium]